MWFFGHRKREEKAVARELEIQAVRQETLKKIDEANRKSQDAKRELDRALEDRGDLAYLIFKATGAERRNNGRS